MSEHFDAKIEVRKASEKINEQYGKAFDLLSKITPENRHEEIDLGNSDRLRVIFDMQSDLDERIIAERNIEKELSEWVTGLTIAMESEIDEIRREVNWKWWKNPKDVDIDALQGEVIDMWHFLLSLSRVAGLTPETIYAKYLEKNKENHDRQSGKTSKEGYEIE